MKHNVILQAISEEGTMHTWKYYSIKGFLEAENHIYEKDDWKFHKGSVNGIELEYSDDLPVLMRDVDDFKTYCRQNVNRKEIKSEVPVNILEKLLLEESENKREQVYDAIFDGVKNVDDFYNNGGGGYPEYRAGEITGYNFFGKTVEISWVNEELDECIGTITRNAIYREICNLISKGKYYIPKEDKNPRKLKLELESELEGQMSIMDFIVNDERGSR